MKSVNLYNSAIMSLCNDFVEKYFNDAYGWDIVGDANMWWWPVEVSYYFFSIDNIVCALSNDMPKEVLLKWYDDSLEEYKEGWRVKMNLYNYYLKNK